MRVLELYSGIGGMHLALSASSLDFEIVKALDINDTANKVYNSIHPGMLAHNRTLESLSESECLGLKADLWTMSPPCQPFTRMGKRRLGEDNRSLSFHRIIALIQTYILFSNKKCPPSCYPFGKR
uniref:DNA (Cytosine-5)-methyltransferase n=1 Tax=Schistocephalus solidus TaxID=70667 RepID=A0A0X3PPA4_SCHSO